MISLVTCMRLLGFCALAQSMYVQPARDNLFGNKVGLGLGQEGRCQAPKLPLQGSMKAHFSTNDYVGIKSKYNAQNIVVYWDSEHGFYSWRAPFVKPQDGHAAEVGYAKWLQPFMYSQGVDGARESRAYVGTRVDVAAHTSCCCQYIR